MAQIMAAYSKLIGNSDRHFENISLLLDGTGDVCDVAPAYDILPMKYAPIGAGVVPELSPIAPKLGSIGVRAGVWNAAGRAAQEFWTQCRDDERIGLSPSMRALAGVNRRVVEQFVVPLVPSDTRLVRFEVVSGNGIHTTTRASPIVKQRWAMTVHTQRILMEQFNETLPC